MSKYFLNNAKTTLKSPENDFFDHQNSQKWLLKTAKMSKYLIENLYFWGHLSTFEAENTPKSRHFKVKKMF